MFRKRRKSTNKSRGLFSRIFRLFVAIVILTGFVYGIALGTKQIASLNEDKFASLISPVTDTLGMDEDVAGEVAGKFVTRFSQTTINKSPKIDNVYNVSSSTGASTSRDVASSLQDDFVNEESALAKIAFIADAHETWDMLEKSLDVSQDASVDYIFYLGDLTDWGDLTSLQKGQEILETSNVPVFVLPGDHDLAQSASITGGNGLENFMEVFDENYSIVTVSGIKFMLLDNSANFTPMDEERFTWFLNNVSNVDYVVLSQPLYHETSTLLMGIVDGEEDTQVNNQRLILLSKIRQSANVKAIFAADHHRSSVSVDPERSTLKHFVIGALTKSRNIQTPRFSILTIFEDNTYDLAEITL